MTPNQIEQIDRYHSGQMSEHEVATFESQMQADPSLKAESDFQADIIDGLKEYRKLELKARLDAINIGPTWGGFIQKSSLIKSLGGVMVASLIGSGIYLYGEEEESQDSINQIEINAPVAEKIEFTPIEPIQLSYKTNAQALTIESKKLPENLNRLDQLAKDESPVEAGDDNQPSTEVAFTPSFEAPTVESVEEAEFFESEGLDKLPENAISTVVNNPIDVKTQITKSQTIKYKYYDGKLFLSGDFNKAPYEILEINSASGRRIYIYYLNNYYKVGITDKLRELPLVRDREVLKELQALQENK